MLNVSDIDNVEGPNLTIRLIMPDDASYVRTLRTDPTYNRHLSEVRGTVEDQRQWIEGYKSREADGDELYYVIQRKDGTRCGLVRLYEIGDNSFTWGSWILDANKPRKAALESALLSFSVGFDRLNLPRAFVDVRADNEKARSFYVRLGMVELLRDSQDIYFVYERKVFEGDRNVLLRIIEEEIKP